MRRMQRFFPYLCCKHCNYMTGWRMEKRNKVRAKTLDRWREEHCPVCGTSYSPNQQIWDDEGPAWGVTREARYVRARWLFRPWTWFRQGHWEFANEVHQRFLAESRGIEDGVLALAKVPQIHEVQS